LTGILLGSKCIKKNYKRAVLYIGMNPYTSRVAACLKGIIEAGVHVPASEDSFPEQDRLDGIHIAEYAKLLQEDKSKYESRFSTLLKNGLKPEDYPNHVQKLKDDLMKGTFANSPSTATVEDEVGK
jgi:large subunit ribosomal protein L18